MWKAVNEILPTGFNLWKKKVIDTNLCSICQREEEPIVHVLWKCLTATDVWSEAEKSIKKLSIVGTELMTVWQQIIEKLKLSELELVVCVIIEDNFENPRQLFSSAKQSLVEYQSAHEKMQDVVQQRDAIRHKTRWKKPEGRYVKTNWNAVVNSKDKHIGIGIIIRNAEGEVLASLCDVVHNCSKPIVAGVAALRSAVNFCIELGMSLVCLEGDAQTIVNAVKSKEVIGTDYGMLIEDVRKLLLEREDWKIKFVHREAYSMAYLLAKLVLSIGEEKVWLEECPSQVFSSVLKENDKDCNEHSNLMG